MMDDYLHYAKQIYSRCEELALATQTPGQVDRRYLSPQHKEVNLLLAQWMQEAGLQSWQDEAGNQWGRLKSANPEAKTLIMGSHSDTVPNGGKYDGLLGVLLPITLSQYLTDNQRSLPFNLDIVAFGDEEGTRFGTTLLGSRAIAGTWVEKWGSLTDENGISLTTALRDFGLDINHIHHAAIKPDSLIGFVETHIEQGPVLEANELSVGVVTGISGARRFVIRVEGNAGHAGTVPMNMRSDALCAAAEMITSIETIAHSHEVVATVGKIETTPNAVNVIPGEVVFSLDIRSLHDSHRDNAVVELFTLLGKIATHRNVTFSSKETHNAEAVKCDASLTNKLSDAIKAQGIVPFPLVSGAGHDAMAMAQVCPVAMLFTRCEKGISHNPLEAITTEDVAVSLSVLNSFIEECAKDLEGEEVLFNR